MELSATLRTTWFRFRIFFDFKGTVSTISSDTSYEDFNVRFTTVPLKTLSDQALKGVTGYVR